MKKYLIIVIAAVLLNPWWWLILRNDLLVGFLAIASSILIFIWFFDKGSRRLLFSILLLTMVMIFVNLSQGFDERLLRNSQLDIQKFHRRHEFYGQGLGKLYKNRISLAFFKIYQPLILKIQTNFSENLDPNLYFFANHPRERGGINEFEKYLPIFLPFFIIGILHSIYKPRHKIVIYTGAILIISSLISPQYKLGPILIFPVINYVMSIGFILFLKFLQKVLRNEQ